MAVIRKGPHYIGVAEVHSDANTRVSEQASIVVRDIYRVAYEIFVHRTSHVLEQQKMQLVDVERVQFARTVFNNPVLDRALFGDEFGVVAFMSNIFGVCPSSVR